MSSIRTLTLTFVSILSLEIASADPKGALLATGMPRFEATCRVVSVTSESQRLGMSTNAMVFLKQNAGEGLAALGDLRLDSADGTQFRSLNLSDQLETLIIQGATGERVQLTVDRKSSTGRLLYASDAGLALTEIAELICK